MTELFGPTESVSGSPSHSGEGPGSVRILFVCTGNTCRSPLAAALARRALEDRGWGEVEVRSAGVAARPGDAASEGSLRAAERHGLDLSGHRSALFTSELAEWADLILTMSPGHLTAVDLHGGGPKAAVITNFVRDEASSDTLTHPGGGVADPVGGDDADYEATYHELRDLVDRALARLV